MDIKRMTCFYGLSAIALKGDSFFGEIPVTNPPNVYPCLHTCMDSDIDSLESCESYHTYPFAEASGLTGVTLWFMTAVRRLFEP